MAPNKYWVIRGATGAGVYHRRTDADQHGYTQLVRKGRANAFATEKAALQYLNEPVPKMMSPRGIVAWVRRQNPLLRLMIAAVVIQGALFAAFRAMVRGEKYLACDETGLIKYNQICVAMLEVRVAVFKQQAKAIDVVAKELIVLISILSYEVFGWLDQTH